jgi:hypothetical protein
VYIKLCMYVYVSEWILPLMLEAHFLRNFVNLNKVQLGKLLVNFYYIYNI